MSVRVCQQCTATNKNGKRCKRNTCRTELCFQHLRSVSGLRLAPSNIPEGGIGLFAAKPFKTKDTVAPYTGEIHTSLVEGPYVLQATKSKFIDAAKSNTAAGRFANDCRSKNKKTRGFSGHNKTHGFCKGNNTRLSWNANTQKASVKATKAINAGDEIYASYSAGYWH